MKILIVGGGGREHALAWKAKQSSLVEKIFCAPGNAGTAEVAENIKFKANDIAGLLAFALENQIDLTIVGPEDPLVAGLVDQFEAAGLQVFGPRQNAAILEGSKMFTKDFLKRHGIPTADYAASSDPKVVRYSAHAFGFPVVIKADGLAAGKGVVICKDDKEINSAIQSIMVDKVFGEEAGKVAVVEEFLDGEEASYIVLVDRNGNVLSLASSQDHKRVGDDDTGPNTGGMGAYSPAPIVTPEVEQKVLERIIYPVVRGMAAEGRPFVGFLYAGLMIKDGEPKVLEFNVRMGDPETQPILDRMQCCDLVAVILAALEGKLDDWAIRWNPCPAVCVVMASKGYPGDYEKGFVISGLEEAADQNAMVFHAGTAKNKAGEIVTAGGRVLGVTALGRDFAEAKKNAYRAVEEIRCSNLFYRKDIADRAIKR